jgi:hypothetical protein
MIFPVFLGFLLSCSAAMAVLLQPATCNLSLVTVSPWRSWRLGEKILNRKPVNANDATAAKKRERFLFGCHGCFCSRGR